MSQGNQLIVICLEVLDSPLMLIQGFLVFYIICISYWYLYVAIDSGKRRHIYCVKQSTSKEKVMKLLKEYCMLFTPDKFSQINTMAESDLFP